MDILADQAQQPARDRGLEHLPPGTTRRIAQHNLGHVAVLRQPGQRRRPVRRLHRQHFGPDGILLDLGLPDMDGQQVLAELRRRAPAPVIVLPVRGAERDKVAALDHGADDYLTKQFGIAELLARMRIALRRAAPPALAAGTTPGTGPLVAGDLALDPLGHTVTLRGTPVHLSPTEFNLLELLMRHAGKVVTHQTLLHTVWGPEYIDNTRVLRVYISQLREKIEPDPDRPTYIRTEPGIGYRFQEASESTGVEYNSV